MVRFYCLFLVIPVRFQLITSNRSSNQQCPIELWLILLHSKVIWNLFELHNLYFIFFRGIAGVLDWEVTKKLYLDMVKTFEKLLLPTYASCHVQFLMFYICSFRTVSFLSTDELHFYNFGLWSFNLTSARCSWNDWNRMQFVALVISWAWSYLSSKLVLLLIWYSGCSQNGNVRQ